MPSKTPHEKKSKGTLMAEEARKRTNNLSRRERTKLTNAAMALIYAPTVQLAVVEHSNDYWIIVIGQKPEVCAFFYADQGEKTPVVEAITACLQATGTKLKKTLFIDLAPFIDIKGEEFILKSPSKKTYTADCEGDCLKDFLAAEGTKGLRKLAKVNP